MFTAIGYLLTDNINEHMESFVDIMTFCHQYLSKVMSIVDCTNNDRAIRFLVY